FFGLPQLKATRAITGHSVPIIAWVTCGASMFIRIWGPESLGGLGDFVAKVDAEVARTGGLFADVAEKLPVSVPVKFHTIDSRECLLSCDAFLMASSDAYEKESIDALRGWFASELRKPSYTVGPLLAVSVTTRSDINKNAGVEVFLDEMLQNHGKRSVFFISFGTIFWPVSNIHYLEEVVDAFIEKKIPFILSHASPFAQIPPQMSKKIDISKIGLLTSWSPQQFILNHPATGWFLTHGGHGGVTESLSSGIPLIFWPFEADQPSAAAHVTENLRAGFELLEVRTGRGLGPIHRNGKIPKGTREAVGEEIRRVLDACQSKEGAEMRANAERIKTEFKLAWEEGGHAKLAMRHFLEDYAQRPFELMI
ncbi:hypothetical protein H0H81_011179, partial [Sphagnurus paluster]